MSELKEIEITFKVKVATYKPKDFIEKQNDILNSYMDATYDIVRSKGITDYGNLVISNYIKQLAINNTHSDTQSHPIEPVAMRYDFDGYGYMYIDSGSGSDWKTRKKGEFLYTHPPIAFADLEEGQSIPLYEHPMRELTDEEIMELSYLTSDNDPIDFARAILKKAREHD